jgi:hypothetical protein
LHGDLDLAVLLIETMADMCPDRVSLKSLLF